MPRCQHVTLAKNGLAHLQLCPECECVSLHLGCVTVRLDPPGLEALWAVLGEATFALHTPQTAAQRDARKSVS